MFVQQLHSELVPSLQGSATSSSLNNCSVMRRLLERHTGFSQFRVVLAEQDVTLSAEAAQMRGEDKTRVSLQEAIRAYLPEDQPRIVEVVTEAIQQQKGYTLRARRKIGDKLRVIETIADVVVADGKVTEIVGYSRDVSETVEREALGISRARLIGHLIEDMPVPIVVLDRALQVVACSAAWARSHGLAGRQEALGQPINRLIELSKEATAAIIEAMHGKTAQFTAPFYSAEDGLPVKRRVVVTAWQCGSEATGGVLMMAGEEMPAYATLEVADRAFGRRTRNLLEMLEAAAA